MGNTPIERGAAAIRDAEELFYKSVAEGSPDFRYPALVIGQNPLVPPKWAIEACIEERRRTERVAASRESEKHARMLDEMAVVLIEHFNSQSKNKGKKARTGVKSKSVRSMSWEAAKRLDDIDHNTSDVSLRPIVDRWNEEQELASDKAQLIAGQKLTPRISRIQDELFGEEFGTSKDPLVDAYWQYRRHVMCVPD